MKKLLLMICLVPALLIPVRAGEHFSLTGYYKSFFMGFQLPQYRNQIGIDLSNPPLGAVNNRLRLKLAVNASSWMKLEMAYDFSPRIQDPLLFSQNVFLGDLESSSYRFDDFNARLYPGAGEAVSSFGVFHNLDRFFVSIKTNFADIFIGRQAIAWGSAYVTNPTDVVAPFTFNELDTEERRGVDAIRMRIPLGAMDELDVGYIFGDNFEFSKSAFYVRGKFYIWQTDLALLVMGFRENLLLGLDISRSIAGAGFRFEAAYVVPDYFDKTIYVPDTSDDPYLRASLGLDYNFGGNLYVYTEYHINTAAEKDPLNYNDYFLSTAFQEGTAYLMGRHYLALGMTYQLSPLIPFSSMILYNLGDNSFSFSPSLEYNIAENIYLSLGAYLAVGKRPEINRLHSEFGAYPHMLFSSFRYYF